MLTLIPPVGAPQRSVRQEPVVQPERAHEQHAEEDYVGAARERQC